MSKPDTAVILMLVICLSAVLPVLLRSIPIPGVVYEIVLGAVIGPQVLGMHVGPVVDTLSKIGLGVLFLMAGFEVEPKMLRGAPIRLALRGWLLGLVIGFGCVGLLSLTGAVRGVLLTTVALSTTAIGTLLPVLRDQGWLKPPYGTQVLAIGAIGEAAPLIAVSLILAGGRADWQAGILLLFALAAAAAMALAGHSRRRGLFVRLLEHTMEKSGQFPVRISIFLMIALIALSEEFDIDLVLGAFVAGALLRTAIPNHLHKPLLARLDGIGYGFTIPIFFVVSGMGLDLRALVSGPETLMLVPVFALIMLLARGLPVLWLYPDLPGRKALALHASTQLPLVVAIGSIGFDRGVFSAAQASAMVGAALLTLILFPSLATLFRPGSEAAETPDPSPSVEPEAWEESPPRPVSPPST